MKMIKYQQREILQSKKKLKHMQWYMYVILCFDNSLYCGITIDLEKRLKQHNGVLKGGAKYTRGRRPCKYVHVEEALNRSEASKKRSKV